MLDLQLEVFIKIELAGQTLIFEPFTQSTVKQRPDRIIAAAGIADGDDDDRWDSGATHPLLSELITCPAGSTSSTVIGILPSACVAQDRQGS